MGSSELARVRRIAGFSLVAVLVAFLLVGCSRDSRREEDPSVARRAAEPNAAELTVPKRVHPKFSFTMNDLEQLSDSLPVATEAAILESPERFLELVSHTLTQPPELVWLVDKQHPLPADYAPADLVPLDDYESLSLSREGHRLRELIMPDLLAMSEAAGEEGIELIISSTYRSYAYQEELYAYWVSELGEEEASRVSARPGRSQHQLGTTIDFGCICDAFAETDAGRWLAENAWRFGFSLSYPDGLESITGYAYESWHFRYVGRPAAQLERQFFGSVQQHMTEFFDTYWDTLFSALIVV